MGTALLINLADVYRRFDWITLAHLLRPSKYLSELALLPLGWGTEGTKGTYIPFSSFKFLFSLLEVRYDLVDEQLDPLQPRLVGESQNEAINP
jgi:hypothetical protein